jgi:hypothetical protein
MKILDNSLLQQLSAQARQNPRLQQNHHCRVGPVQPFEIV